MPHSDFKQTDIIENPLFQASSGADSLVQTNNFDEGVVMLLVLVYYQQPGTINKAFIHVMLHSTLETL